MFSETPKAQDVREGDRVGLLVTPQGEGKVFCNGALKARRWQTFGKLLHLQVSLWLI